MSEHEHDEERPPKPPIEDMPPEEGEAPPTDEQEAEDADGVEFIDPDQASQDDSIDDQEQPDPVSTTEG